ncbi:hypothetical protein JCM18909_3800 [Cutibacterium acnes JCM 18909]|nr:hypothetical protein JCM18909_3800 [Cutibacterium acnes JCM 18909]
MLLDIGLPQLKCSCSAENMTCGHATVNVLRAVGPGLGAWHRAPIRMPVLGEEVVMASTLRNG